MTNLIETNPIEGFKVYGQQMVEYTVDGIAGNDFASATAIAALAESSSIEEAAAAYANVIRARQKKLEEMGDAMAILSKAIATLPVKNQKSTDKSDADDALYTAKANLERYGVSLSLTDGNKVTRKTAETARNNAEYSMDVEDNDLQQDMVTLQGLVSKRDNAFSTASKVLKKVASTGKAITRAIGG